MKDLLSKLGVAHMRKLVVHVVGMLAVLFGAAELPGFMDGMVLGMDQTSVVQLVLAVLTAVGVYQVANDPDEPEAVEA